MRTRLVCSGGGRWLIKELKSAWSPKVWHRWSNWTMLASQTLTSLSNPACSVCGLCLDLDWWGHWSAIWTPSCLTGFFHLLPPYLSIFSVPFCPLQSGFIISPSMASGSHWKGRAEMAPATTKAAWGDAYQTPDTWESQTWTRLLITSIHSRLRPRPH